MNPIPAGGTYSDSVDSLRTSLSFLESSVNTLGEAVSDYPRITSVLKTVRHYELIPQPTLSAAEASLRDEIGPFISLLVDRAQSCVERVERKIDTLKARAELNQGRISSSSSSGSGAASASAKKSGGRSAGGGSAGRGGKKLGPDAKLRAKILQQRKAQLQYGIERLELEVTQKERELRRRLEGR